MKGKAKLTNAICENMDKFTPQQIEAVYQGLGGKDEAIACTTSVQKAFEQATREGNTEVATTIADKFKVDTKRIGITAEFQQNLENTGAHLNRGGKGPLI
jgi:hypothetical protein